jgi:hypothetical protein
MKAIAVEFTSARSRWVPPEQAVVDRPHGSRLKTDFGRPETDLRQLSDGDQRTAPFWTWFIENPRRWVC